MVQGSSGYSMSRHRKARRGSLRSYRLAPPVMEFEAFILELARQKPLSRGRRKRSKRPVHKATAPLMRKALEPLVE